MLCLTEALEVKLVDSRIRNRIKKFYAYVAITSVSVEQGQLNCCIQAYVNIDAEQLLPTTPSLEKVLLSTLIFSRFRCMAPTAVRLMKTKAFPSPTTGVSSFETLS